MMDHLNYGVEAASNRNRREPVRLLVDYSYDVIQKNTEMA
jgi:hypothetical protein